MIRVAMADYQNLFERLRDAYNDRDPDAWVAAWNPDAEWHPFLTAREEGDPGYHGHNGMRAWFEDLDEMYEQIHVELGQFRQVGDKLLVPGRMTAIRRGTGREVGSDVGWVFEPKGERLQRGWAYGSREDAERAAKR